MSNAESTTSSSSSSPSQHRGRRLFRGVVGRNQQGSIFPTPPPMILQRQKEVVAEHFLGENDQQVDVQDEVAGVNNDGDDDTEKAASTIHNMLQQLSPEELETAARFSYEYFTLNNNNTNNNNNKEMLANNKKTSTRHSLQLQYAKKLATIYLSKHSNDSTDASAIHSDDAHQPENNKNNKNNSRVAATTGDAATTKRALADLKATLQFRQQFNVDALRTAFDTNRQQQQLHNDDSSPQQDCTSNDFHETLFHNLNRQKNLYVQGYDRDGRSTYIFIPRNVQHFDTTWTLREHVYTLERALACTKARDNKVNAVVDFNGYNRNVHAPPLRLGLEFLNVLGHYYGPCLNRVFIVDAPMTFMVIWTVLKPIVNKLASRNKVHIEFVQSQKSKTSKSTSKNNNNRHHNNNNHVNVLERYYEPHQAASWMLPAGTRNRDLDVHEYLHQTPFNRAFDEQ